MLFMMSKMMVTLLRHTLCRPQAYYDRPKDRERGWGYPCDSNGWVTLDCLAEAWQSRQGNDRLFRTKCALMEELYSYTHTKTINGYAPQRPHYPRGGPNFRLPNYRNTYHKGMIRKGLFDEVQREGLANPAVVIHCTLMAPENNGK